MSEPSNYTREEVLIGRLCDKLTILLNLIDRIDRKPLDEITRQRLDQAAQTAQDAGQIAWSIRDAVQD